MLKKYEQIKEAPYGYTYMLKKHEEDKQGILDVRVFVRTQAKENILKKENQEEKSRSDTRI